jgi:hypothetical protein
MKEACEAAVDDLVVEGRRVPSGPGGLGPGSHMPIGSEGRQVVFARECASMRLRASCPAACGFLSSH